MDLIDIFRALIRWVHVIAAVAWVGGGIFYLLVLTPAWADSVVGEQAEMLRRAIGSRFRELTGTCILALVVTGVIITIDRLSDPRVTLMYGILLGLKLLLVAFMYVIFRQLGDPGRAKRWNSPETMLGLGVLVFFITVALRLTYEASLRAAIG